MREKYKISFRIFNNYHRDPMTSSNHCVNILLTKLISFLLSNVTDVT